MKIDFRIDIRAETEAHYTTFPQTEQSAKLLQRNRTNLIDGAKQQASTLSSRAVDKAVANGPGSRVDVIA